MFQRYSSFNNTASNATQPNFELELSSITQELNDTSLKDTWRLHCESSSNQILLNRIFNYRNPVSASMRSVFNILCRVLQIVIIILLFITVNVVRLIRVEFCIKY